MILRRPLLLILTTLLFNLALCGRSPAVVKMKSDNRKFGVRIFQLYPQQGSRHYYTFDEHGAKRYHSLHRPGTTVELAQTEGLMLPIHSSSDLFKLLSATRRVRLEVRAFLVQADREQEFIRDLDQQSFQPGFNVAKYLVPDDVESIPPGLLGEIKCGVKGGISLGRLMDGHSHTEMTIEVCRHSGISRLVHPSMTATKEPEMMPGTSAQVVRTSLDSVSYRMVLWFQIGSRHAAFRVPWLIRLIDDKARMDKQSLMFIDKKVLVPRSASDTFKQLYDIQVEHSESTGRNFNEKYKRQDREETSLSRGPQTYPLDFIREFFI